MNTNASENFSLEQRFSLILTGPRNGFEHPVLPAPLVKLLQMKGQLEDLLRQCPTVLAQHTQRPTLQLIQQKLFDAGFDSTIEQAWSYRGLAISDQLLNYIDALHINQQEQLLGFALLQIQPQPGVLLLQQLSKSWDHIDHHVLSRSTALLEMEPLGRDGIGQVLRNIRSQATNLLQESDPSSPWKCQISFALWPEDGATLCQLLDTLIRRLQVHPDDSALHDALKQNPVVAGQGFARILRLGEKPDEDDQLEPEALAYLHAQWPLPELWTAPDTADNRKANIDRALRVFKDNQADRSLRAKLISQRLGQLKQVPSLPRTTHEIIALSEDPEADVEALVRLVKNDPGLSARILSVVNSAAFGLRQGIDNLEHAVLILGFQEISQLAMALSSDSLFNALGSEQGNKMWRHATTTAHMAAGLANKLNLPPGRIFTSGLLHDVGHIMLHQIAADTLPEIQARSERLELPSYEIEREIFGFDHAAVGAYLLRRWGLPESICASVEHHHGGDLNHSESAITAALIGLADHLAHTSSQSQSWCHSTRLRQCHADALHDSLAAANLRLIDLLQGNERRAGYVAAA